MDYLYGKLNNEVKNIEYKGKETDTALVSVDSKENTISVDVLKVPNKLSVVTLLGKTIYYDGGSPIYINLRSEVDDTPKDGSYKVVTSGGVKEYVDTSLENLSDKKLDKSTTPEIVYSTDSLGNQIVIEYDDSPSDGTMVKRTSNGTIKSNDPLEESDVVTKKYADDIRENIQHKLDDKFDKTGGTIYGDLVVEQNLTIKGTTTTVDTKNLEVKDNLITVAKDNVAPLIAPAGLRVPKYDGTNDGALVFDSNGTAYVGDVVLDGDGNIDAEASTGLQPIATRTGLVNGRLVQWDGANTTLVDSGIQPWEIVKKYTNDYMPSTGQEGVYGYDGTEQTFYEFGIGFSQYGNIPKYVDDGNGLPSIPVVNMVKDETVEGYAINKAYTDANYVAKKTTTDGIRLYAYDSNGDTSEMASATVTPYTIARRDVSGHVRTADPKDATDAVNKEYAEANFVSKIKDNTTGNYILYAEESGHPGLTLKVNPSDGINQFNGPEFIPKYGQNCQLYALTDGGDFPASDEKACLTNKQYVEDNFVPKTTTAWRIYATNSNGEQALLNYTAIPSNLSIMQRDSTGRAEINTPTDAMQIANKKYVDDNFVPISQGLLQLYGTDPSTRGKVHMYQITPTPTASGIPQYGANGVLKVADPEGQNDATTKKYVDGGFVAKQKTTSGDYVYGYNSSGDSTYRVSVNADSNTIVLRDDDVGGIKVGSIDCNGMLISNSQILGDNCSATFHSASLTFLGVDYRASFSGEVIVQDGTNVTNPTAPTDDSHLTNKKYVDNLNTIMITAGA